MSYEQVEEAWQLSEAARERAGTLGSEQTVAEFDRIEIVEVE